MKSVDLIGHIKFLLWGQLDGCSMTRPFLSLRRVWLARQLYNHPASHCLVSVPDPKPTPAWIAFSIACVFPRVILEAIYAPDEVWGRDYPSLGCCSTVNRTASDGKLGEGLGTKLHVLLFHVCTFAVYTVPVLYRWCRL